MPPAGVMIYVSFAEVLTESIALFACHLHTDEEDGVAYAYGTLSFFGGFLMYALTHKLVHYLQGGPASSGLAREEDEDEGEATPTADGSTEGPAAAELVTQSATTPILNDGEPAAPDKDDEDGSEDGCVEGGRVWKGGARAKTTAAPLGAPRRGSAACV